MTTSNVQAEPAREIQPLRRDLDATVQLLGSQSYTNRFLAMGGLAAFDDHRTVLHGALVSDDTTYLARAIESLGHVRISIDQGSDSIVVQPTGAAMRAPQGEVFMGNAGTGLRLFVTMASLASGRTLITGNARMQERPMGDLLEALGPLGVPVQAERGNGSPPISVHGPSLAGGATRINGGISSQFTTSLLITAPYAAEDVEISVAGELVSKPYVDMTVAAMRQCGIRVERHGYHWFRVAAGQRYPGGRVAVEPDASGMSYFMAAAAVTGGRVRIPGIGASSMQGDVDLVRVLADMGCAMTVRDSEIIVTGGPLTGVEVDMNSMPDAVPALAVVAAYAAGRTHITGIGNLRLKECDRIDALCAGLARMGVRVAATTDTMTIEGGTPHGAVIDTCDDHRIAMSFAIAGLRTPGVVITNPGCVARSFPSFWEKLAQLRAGGL